MPEPWMKLPGESPSWHLRFTRFRLQGPRRSMEAVYRGEVPEGARRCRAPGVWDRVARRWRWVERATQWDLAEAQRLAQGDAEDRLAARQRRRALLLEAATKLETALAAMDPAKLSPFATILAIKTIAKELRAEYDDQPMQRHALGGLGGGPVEITLELTPPRDWIGDGPRPDCEDDEDEEDQ